jgi:hypothetical protein
MKRKTLIALLKWDDWTLQWLLLCVVLVVNLNIIVRVLLPGVEEWIYWILFIPRFVASAVATNVIKNWVNRK